MRLNKFIAAASGLSRRAADEAIQSGRVEVNGGPPTPGQQVSAADTVDLDGRILSAPAETTTIMLNKPAGYICSRDGQGSRTVYDLLPSELHNLKTVGRLDKESSGLLLLTSDGDLAHRLTHPSFVKVKVYEVSLRTNVAPLHRQMISDHGVILDDGISRFELMRLHDGDDKKWEVRMHEGRNRQIRRTFETLGYEVRRLHRTHFGDYSLGDLKSGSYLQIAA